MCKKIHRGGNAEQYNADKKYKEAVAVAVEACVDDLREAVEFLEDSEGIARRVLGGAHPVVRGIEHRLLNARVVLAAREKLMTYNN